jgi:hypothetical protein
LDRIYRIYRIGKGKRNKKDAGFMPRLAEYCLVASKLNQDKRSSSAVDGWAGPVK